MINTFLMNVMSGMNKKEPMIGIYLYSAKVDLFDSGVDDPKEEPINEDGMNENHISIP